MSSLRFRLRFNQQTGGAAKWAPGNTKGAENFSRIIVEEVGLRYATGLYEKLKRDIQGRMQSDIQRELNHTARMFMTSIVGADGRKNSATGEMTTKAPRADAMLGIQLKQPLDSITKWPKRSKDYMRDRDKKGQGNAWFRRNYPSPLDKLKSASAWSGAYGGFSVSITQTTKGGLSKSPGAKAVANRLSGTRGGNARVGVANIRVEAMRRITTQMLPALGGGRLGDYGASPRGNGLLSKLGPDIANRLGGNPINVPFRPTIQPFLGFFLTRQLPNAVLKRIEQGMIGTLNLRDVSGYRAEGNTNANARLATMQKPLR